MNDMRVGRRGGRKSKFSSVESIDSESTTKDIDGLEEQYERLSISSQAEKVHV